MTAKDKATAKEQSIRITSSSGLSKEEVAKMKKDAESHSSEDRKRKEEIEMRNQADSLVFQTEKQLKEFGDKLNAETRNKVESAKEKVKEALKSNNASAIKSAMDSLTEAWSEASGQMYQQAKGGTQRPGPEGPQGGPSGAGSPPPKDEKRVEDAQYEVMDDKDKK